MTTARPRRDLEHPEQVALFNWAALRASARPELRLLHAIPNFARLRTKREAARRNAEGLKAGVPDLCLPVPRGAFHGLYIEMKSATGKPTPKQRWWLDQLQEQGYRAEVCHGFEEARRVIERYLDGRG